MKKIYLSTLIALFCISAGVGAQVTDRADQPILEKIARENTAFSTIESLFIQTQYIAMMEDSMISGGKFYYSKPNRLLMKYDTPKGDMMLINGDRFVMVNAGKRRETSAKSNTKMQKMKNILSACLEGRVMQIGSGSISCEEKGHQYIITVTFDKSANKSGFSKVVVHYDKKDSSLSSLRTIEPDGSYTNYELKDKKINTEIDKTIFQTARKK
ncbi:MAG: outer membrane lipoprotein carrier protein LolA [Prevotellaceae bacterium]|jgi:outer membrane lipoprotein-sorting protein|nr:outer membrane lipoprotein carrier protein LolA [Prevotellaceae bacterium]